MMDSFVWILLALPIFIGMTLAPIEKECDCMVEKLENMWKDERGFRSLEDGFGRSSDKARYEVFKGLENTKTVNDITSFGINPETLVGNNTSLGGKSEDEVQIFLPVPVWKGILYVTGYTASIGVKIGVFLYPFHMVFALFMLFAPLLGSYVNYIVLVPIVLVQEFIIPRLKQ